MLILCEKLCLRNMDGCMHKSNSIEFSHFLRFYSELNLLLLTGKANLFRSLIRTNVSNFARKSARGVNKFILHLFFMIDLIFYLY